MATIDGIETGDSEAASEKQAGDPIEALRSILPRNPPEWYSKAPKRGRPRLKYDPILPHMSTDKYYKELGGGIDTSARTPRGRAEAEYAVRAMWRLFEHREQHPEVLEFTGFIRHGDKEYPGFSGGKRGILAEFGRLISTYADGEEAAVEWAVELANMRPRLSTKRAIAWIRQRRLRKTNLGTAEGVAGAIVKAIDDYLANHPGTSREMISRALAGVAWIYDEEDEEDEYEPLQARGRADRPAPDPPADGRVRSSRP